MAQWERYRQVWRGVAMLDQDFLIDFDDDYQATDSWVMGLSDESRAELVEQIDALFVNFPDARARLAVMEDETWFRLAQAEHFDVWLQALRQRAVEALAGIHSNPMVTPLVMPTYEGDD